jgi:propionate CoA-transferase
VITHLYRDFTAGKPGTISRVGIGTFVDPRLESAKVNAAAKEDIVELVNLTGDEILFFKAFPINVAFIRGTSGDPDANITMERESLRLETLSLALAARNSGGLAICQVERIAESGSLDARQVRVPGIAVDAVVMAEPAYHRQNYGTEYNPALSGELRVPVEALPAPPLDEKKIIARRAAMELTPNSVINLGIGLPDMIGLVANEESIQDLITLTVDPGVFGGVPLGGLDFGASVNFSASVDHTYQFDFIDGGGLDSAYLGFAECDCQGNINASRFANRISGCGSFINISQNSKKVVFVSTFTSGGLETDIEDGRLSIKKEGKYSKFVETVSQVTFSGRLAANQEKEIYYVTERCVFRLAPGGLELIEVAPGTDVEEDILSRMSFDPVVDEPKPMDPAIFREERMGLRDRMIEIHMDDRLSYDPESNTVFMNFAGMRVRTGEDLNQVVKAVDDLLGPLGRRVNAIINYDKFQVEEDVFGQHIDAVRYVEERYYLKVSRHTTSGFMRLRLGKELAARRVSSAVFESPGEARRNIQNN